MTSPEDLGIVPDTESSLGIVPDDSSLGIVPDDTPGGLEQAHQQAIAKGRKRIANLQAGQAGGVDDLEALSRGVLSGVTAGATEGAAALAGAGGDREQLEGSIPYFVGQNIIAPIVPVGELSKVVTGAKLGAKELLKKAVVTGPRMGAVFGAGGGVSVAAQSQDPTIAGALKEMGKGALTGGLLGLALGAAGGTLAAREARAVALAREAEDVAFRAAVAAPKVPEPAPAIPSPDAGLTTAMPAGDFSIVQRADAIGQRNFMQQRMAEAGIARAEDVPPELLKKWSEEWRSGNPRGVAAQPIANADAGLTTAVEPGAPVRLVDMARDRLPPRTDLAPEDVTAMQQADEGAIRAREGAAKPVDVAEPVAEPAPPPSPDRPAIAPRLDMARQEPVPAPSTTPTIDTPAIQQRITRATERLTNQFPGMDPADASSAMQVAANKALENYKPGKGAKPETFVERYMTNAARDLIKAEKAKKNRMVKDAEPIVGEGEVEAGKAGIAEPAGKAEGADVQAMRAEELDLVNRDIASLPPKRKALMQAIAEGRDPMDMGLLKELDLSPSAARNQIAAARALLSEKARLRGGAPAPTPKPKGPRTLAEREQDLADKIAANLKRKSGLGISDPNVEFAELLAQKAALVMEKLAKSGRLVKAVAAEAARSVVGQRTPGRPQTLVEKFLPVQDMINPVLSAKMRAAGELEHRASQFEGLLNNVASKAKVQHLDDLDKFLKGNAEAGDRLPFSVREAAQDFRTAVDDASAAFADNNKGLSEQMRQTIVGNAGKYINRSFQIHNERGWLARAKKAMDRGDTETAKAYAAAYRDVIDEVKGGSRVPLTDQQAMNVVDDWLEWHAQQAIGKDLAAMSDKARVPQNALRRRKDLSEGMLTLLGEEHDPIVTAGRTAALLSEMNSKAMLSDSLSRLSFDGMPASFADNPNLPGYRLLEGPAYGTLDGKWVHPEIKMVMDETAMIHDQMRSAVMDSVVRFAEAWRRNSGIHQFNAFFKMAKTVGSPVTHVTNFAGNTMFSAFRNNLIQNPVNWPHYTEAVRILAKYSAPAKAAAQRRLAILEAKGRSISRQEFSEMNALKREIADFTLREDLVKNHIIGANYAKAELLSLQAMFRDGMSVPTAMWTAVKRGVKGAQGLYGAGDDVFKAAAVIKEMRNGKFSTWEKAQIDTYRAFPTYTMAGPVLKLAREIPAFNLFISFPAEAARVIIAQTAVAASKGSFLQRIKATAKVMAIVGSVTALEKGIPQLFLSKKERDEFDKNRQLLPGYNRHSNLIPVGKDKDGKWMILDLGQVNPGGGWGKTFRAVAEGDAEAAILSNPIVNAYNQPFIQSSFAAADWYKGRDIRDPGTGRLIASRSEPDAVKAQKFTLWFMGMIGSPIQPGGREYERIKNVNKPDVYGRTINTADLATLYTTGIRPSRWDASLEAGKRMADLKRQADDSRQLMKKEAREADGDKAGEAAAEAGHERRMKHIQAQREWVDRAMP